MERSGTVDRKGQHVRRARFAAMLGVQLRDPLRVDVLDRQVTVPHARRGGCQTTQALHCGERGRIGSELHTKDLNLEHRGRRISGAAAIGGA
jgi:hypothetical protein